MDDAKLIELYKEAMDSIVSSVKNMHTELTTQISNLNEVSVKIYFIQKKFSIKCLAGVLGMFTII